MDKKLKEAIQERIKDARASYAYNMIWAKSEDELIQYQHEVKALAQVERSLLYGVDDDKR